MENDIAAIAAGYVGLRLGIITVCAYWLYKLATFRKPVKIRVYADEIDRQRDRAGRN